LEELRNSEKYLHQLEKVVEVSFFADEIVKVIESNHSRVLVALDIGIKLLLDSFANESIEGG